MSKVPLAFSSPLSSVTRAWRLANAARKGWGAGLKIPILDLLLVGREPGDSTRI